MLTSADELMCHQIVSTFDHVENSDLNSYEKLWFGAFDTSGKAYIGANFGKYINRNVMDACIGVTLDGKTQYNVRASRALYPNVMTTKVGPILYEVLEPLKKFRLCLGENDYGLSLDIEFEGTMPPSEQNPQMFRRIRGRLVNHMCRLYHFGRVSGWIRIEGKTYEVKKDTWWAARDRSWGIRGSIGQFVNPKGEPQEAPFGLQPPGADTVPYFWNFFVVQFKDWGGAYEWAEAQEGGRLGPTLGEIFYGYGDPRKPAQVIDGKNQFKFFPGTRRIKALHQSITTSDGVTRDIEIKPLTIWYRRPAGYGGYKGWTEGLWMGPDWVDGEKLDLSNEKVREEVHYVDDHAIKCQCGGEIGYGIMEPLIPRVADRLTT